MIKNCLAALLVLALVLYVIDLCSESQVASPTSAPAHKVVKADVRFDATTLGIMNLDQTNWPALNVFINGDPPFAYRYVIGSLAPGEAITVLLAEFSKDGSGERFDPFKFKLTKVWIGGKEFDYQSYVF
jgi:hypothetical protein